MLQGIERQIKAEKVNLDKHNSEITNLSDRPKIQNGEKDLNNSYSKPTNSNKKEAQKPT